MFASPACGCPSDDVASQVATGAERDRQTVAQGTRGLSCFVGHCGDHECFSSDWIKINTCDENAENTYFPIPSFNETGVVLNARSTAMFVFTAHGPRSGSEGSGRLGCLLENKKAPSRGAAPSTQNGSKRGWGSSDPAFLLPNFEGTQFGIQKKRHWRCVQARMRSVWYRLFRSKTFPKPVHDHIPIFLIVKTILFHFLFVFLTISHLKFCSEKA